MGKVITFKDKKRSRAHFYESTTSMNVSRLTHTLSYSWANIRASIDSLWPVASNMVSANQC